MGGVLLFSDGTSVTVGALPNAGGPLVINFSTRSITSLQFTVTAVSSSTGNVGLAEIQVYGPAASSSASASATPTSTYSVSATDIALLATATASSQAPGQPASAAIDGLMGGYPYVSALDTV